MRVVLAISLFALIVGCGEPQPTKVDPAQSTGTNRSMEQAVDNSGLPANAQDAIKNNVAPPPPPRK